MVEVEIQSDFEIDTDDGKTVKYEAGAKENVPAETADLWEEKSLAKRTTPLKSSPVAKKVDDASEGQ